MNWAPQILSASDTVSGLNLGGLKERISEHFRDVRERDTKWILQFSVSRLNRLLLPLLLALILLDFADIALTLTALSIGPPLVELNPIASALFRQEFWGFILALALKYLPLLPIAYLVLLDDRPRSPVRVRILKFGVLVALVAAILFSGAVVANNAFTLLAFAF